nr:ATP-binding cassette domain-containing protein [Schlegelella koreensis]
MGAGAGRFELDVAFASAAPRLVLFGPSGAGKSVTLRAIAGLMRPDAGRVRVGAATLFDAAAGIDVAVERRGFGYVFQEYGLFPHLTVRQNVAFGLRRGWRNPPRHLKEPSVERALAALELDGLGDRLPDELSGGQRQRTAVARALAPEPRALLLDEPFAALDSGLRARLRAELVGLLGRLDLPMLLITHDEGDVAAFADSVIPIEAGRVVERHAAGNA